MEVAQQLLKDRLCDMSDRIPTSRWPFYSTSLEATIASGSTGPAFLTFTAERDTLFTDLCIVCEGNNGEVTLAWPSRVSIEYCNTTYADHCDVGEYKCCCDRKPIFLVGVREDKKLRFQIDLDIVAPLTGVNIIVTLSGFQGDGCCS